MIKARKQRARKEEDDAQRRSHYMKCPKCGADLRTEDYNGVQIDRCPDCSGMWLDSGEAEELLAREDAGVINIFKSIMRGVGS